MKKVMCYVLLILAFLFFVASLVCGLISYYQPVTIFNWFGFFSTVFFLICIICFTAAILIR